MELAAAAVLTALAPVCEHLATPALVFDLDAVDHNIAAMVQRCGASRWCPHLKTLKSSGLIDRLLVAGITNFKVATLAELELTLDRATQGNHRVSVLLAYPLARPAIPAVRQIVAAFADQRVHVLVDSREHAQHLARDLAHDLGGTLPVILDVDLGMHRTGPPPTAWASALRTNPEVLAGLTVVGLHGYDGHLAWDDSAGTDAAYDALTTLATELSARWPITEVITSGTHSYAAALRHIGLRGGPWHHRVSPGTITLSDRRSGPAAADLGLRQAAFVISRVVSRHGSRVTLDAGSKAIAPDRPAAATQIFGWPGLEPVGASEEHLVTRATAAVPPLGTLVVLVPDHVCTTVNLYRHAVLIRGHRWVGETAVEASSRRLWWTPPSQPS